MYDDASAGGPPLAVRDASDLPPPITRTTPTTVQYTLTIEEHTAELADGTTYEFWTFGDAVPGPMLRVMQGDTVELTLVNPAENQRSHNIDLHAVNGPGGGAPESIVAPGESKTFQLPGAQRRRFRLPLVPTARLGSTLPRGCSAL